MSSQSIIRIEFALTAAVLLFCAGARAAEQSAPPVPAHAAKLATDWPMNWDWIDEQWTGDDRPFAEARKKIDRLFASGIDVTSVIKTYKTTALSSPSNALDQFQWAYATYCSQNIPVLSAQASIESGRAYNAMAAAQQPHCYNYSRLRLLLMDGWQEEAPLAKRLLKQDPTDIDVQWAYAMSLIDTRGNSTNNAALKIDQAIVDSGQGKPTSYFNLAFVLGSIGMKQKDVGYCERAIAVDKQFLQLASPDDPRREVTQRDIAFNERYQAKLK